jgi:hypothetical protein
MPQQWDEKVPGALWVSPVDQDTLKVKADELGITLLDTVVTAFAQHRYVVGKDQDGALVMLMASADDTMGKFRATPV